jgi:hypothetical protein
MKQKKIVEDKTKAEPMLYKRLLEQEAIQTKRNEANRAIIGLVCAN